MVECERIYGSDPYKAISDIVTKWADEHYYDDFIVKIATGHEPNELIIENQLLLFESLDEGFVWQTDWYEGERYVLLYGFTPVDFVEIDRMSPELPEWLKRRNKNETD